MASRRVRLSFNGSEIYGNEYFTDPPNFHHLGLNKSDLLMTMKLGISVASVPWIASYPLSLFLLIRRLSHIHPPFVVPTVLSDTLARHSDKFGFVTVNQLVSGMSRGIEGLDMKSRFLPLLLHYFYRALKRFLTRSFPHSVQVCTRPSVTMIWRPSHT